MGKCSPVVQGKIPLRSFFCIDKPPHSFWENRSSEWHPAAVLLSGATPSIKSSESTPSVPCAVYGLASSSPQYPSGCSSANNCFTRGCLEMAARALSTSGSLERRSRISTSARYRTDGFSGSSSHASASPFSCNCLLPTLEPLGNPPSVASSASAPHTSGNTISVCSCSGGVVWGSFR